MVEARSWDGRASLGPPSTPKHPPSSTTVHSISPNVERRKSKAIAGYVMSSDYELGGQPVVLALTPTTLERRRLKRRAQTAVGVSSEKGAAEAEAKSQSAERHAASPALSSGPTSKADEAVMKAMARLKLTTTSLTTTEAPGVLATRELAGDSPVDSDAPFLRGAPIHAAPRAITSIAERRTLEERGSLASHSTVDESSPVLLTPRMRTNDSPWPESTETTDERDEGLSMSNDDGFNLPEADKNEPRQLVPQNGMPSAERHQLRPRPCLAHGHMSGSSEGVTRRQQMTQQHPMPQSHTAGGMRQQPPQVAVKGRIPQTGRLSASDAAGAFGDGDGGGRMYGNGASENAQSYQRSRIWSEPRAMFHALLRRSLSTRKAASVGPVLRPRRKSS